MSSFHLALPVDDLDAARVFYTGRLGCPEGRSAPRWVDFDFFGHQLSVHLVDDLEAVETHEVDGDQVPVRHFGVVLSWSDWEALHQRLIQDFLRELSGASPLKGFLIPPRVRFRGEVGEQGTFFLQDPSGNALEFKSFKDPSRLFAC